MAESTATPGTSAAVLSPVEFAGATLFVVEHDGKPFAPMKAISEAMGLDWGGQFTKLKSNTARWGIEEIPIPSAGGIQMMVCIALHKLAGWLTSISPNKIKDLVVRDRVIKYQNECDTALWDYWTKGIAIRPAALPTTITPAQAQHLRELVDLVVASDKQTYGETWNRLHRKMHVNSYLALRPDQFDTACQYLQGKFDDTSIATLIQKHLPGAVSAIGMKPPVSSSAPIQPLPNVDQAMAGANLIAARVQEAVFKQLLEHGEWVHERWLLAFNFSRDGAQPCVSRIEHDAMVVSMARLAERITEPSGMLPSNADLASLAKACNTRLAQRFPATV